MTSLIVPVYLNQRLVFDLLAMLQGGISTVTAVSKTTGTTSAEQEKVNASFGLSQAFSTLLKIDLSGEKSKINNSNDENKSSEERVHTPASLFYQLRNILLEKQILKILSKDVLPIPGDIVEFEASLQRNPLIEALDSLSEIMKMVMLFDDKAGQQKNPKNNNLSTDNQKIQKQMTALSDSLKLGNTIDLTANKLSTGHLAVITAETNFLNDPMMSDLVDGKFKVLGKVIRTLDSNEGSISLIRKSAISKMPTSIMQSMFSALSGLNTVEGFQIPELVWEIPAPAIQILPIAIYA